MANIFKALDGGHLDRALFGSHPKRGKAEAEDNNVPQPRFFRRSRVRPEGQGPAESGSSTRKAPPDRAP